MGKSRQGNSRLASDIDLVTLQAERIYEVAPEAHELLRNIILVLSRHRTGREAGADRLLNPDDVGELVPRPRVRIRLERAALPLKGPVLLDHAAQGRAAGTPVEPDDDLLWLLCRRGWEEPEEHLAVGAVPYVADGQGPGVALANVEVDIWNPGAVDDELCVRGQQLIYPAWVTRRSGWRYSLVVLALRKGDVGVCRLTTGGASEDRL